LKPESLQETYREQVVDKAISICKSAIHKYLDSFLSPYGSNRNYIRSTVSSEGLQYVTDVTYDEEMKTSPNIRKTHLARFFAENSGKLPSIMIIDQGMESENAGINSLVEGFAFGNRWRGTSIFIGKVSLALNVATYSEEDTTTLSQLILYIVDTLSDAVNNKIIRNASSRWEVRLPMAGITSGQLTNVAVEGDTKSQVWMRSIDLQVEIETHASVELPVPQLVQPVTGVVGQQIGVPGPTVMNLAPNQQIKIGEPFQLFIVNLLKSQYLGVSDPNICSVTSDVPWIISPRRVGNCLLYIFDSVGDGTQDLKTGRRKNLVMDIPFRVSL